MSSGVNQTGFSCATISLIVFTGRKKSGGIHLKFKLCFLLLFALWFNATAHLFLR
jgi:hypothetical protein